MLFRLESIADLAGVAGTSQTRSGSMSSTGLSLHMKGFSGGFWWHEEYCLP
jgi:hypothetical protein